MNQSKAAPPVQNDSKPCVTQASHSKTRGFYGELDSKLQTGKVKFCNGTSCYLCGADQQRINLCRAGHDCEEVYCLGHCDRSPVTLDNGCLEYSECPTGIRCAAPEAIVTKHIQYGNVAELNTALENGVYEMLPAALSHSPEHLVGLIEQSGQRDRSRGGASTGEKWRAAFDQKSESKYVIANADEGDPGSFIDRVLLEEDPHTIIEGMILCGYAIGANQGIVYIRSKYVHSAKVINEAIEAARKAGLLGDDICGSGFDFNIRVFVDSENHIFGKESALVNSLTTIGLQPNAVVVNSLETLSNIPYILRHGPDTYKKMGTHAVSGTKAICLNAGFANPGIVEVEWGITLREIIEDIGGGSADKKPLAGVLIGGPMGSIVKPTDWDLPLCYDVLDRYGINIGHGGFVAIPEDTDFRALLANLITFTLEQCTDQNKDGFRLLLDALNAGHNKQRLLKIVNTIAINNESETHESLPIPIVRLLQYFI